MSRGIQDSPICLVEEEKMNVMLAQLKLRLEENFNNVRSLESFFEITDFHLPTSRYHAVFSSCGFTELFHKAEAMCSELMGEDYEIYNSVIFGKPPGCGRLEISWVGLG